MSEEEKSLTSGFETTAEIRCREDVHENVYADKKLLLPTLGVAAVCLLGMIIAIAF